uniref:hypothetical protein n=1 Tax=Nonlabens agnitus TaxID=870484 RepID=UPI0011B232D5|nr:hypothetical protein [Nonlabens agnitus]
MRIRTATATQMTQRIRTFQMTVTYRCLRRARSTMRTVTASHSWRDDQLQLTVTNTGATTLTDITITDPLLVAPNGSLTGALSRALHLERWTRRPLAEATRSSSPTLMRER